MVVTDRAMLRFHIEAVWGVKLPPIEQNEIALLAESARPDWRLYAADLAEGRVLIWRAEITSQERAELLSRLHETAALSQAVILPPGMSREVAFRLDGEPLIDLATSRSIARLLTRNDYPLIEAVWPDGADALLRPDRHPTIGVIINGRLLSLAHSSRRTAQACELGIDTLFEARRKGYALAATIVWSAAIKDEGLTPIYSAYAENSASLRLAVAAGYREFVRGTQLV